MYLASAREAIRRAKPTHALLPQGHQKSKDPNCKVGAVLVSREHLVVSTGFNGMARSLEDDATLLEKKYEKLDWMIHAEHNAVLNAARSGVTTLGCTVYVNKFPCFSCLQILVQAGIASVYSDDREYWKNDPLDSNHEGKRYVIKRANLNIQAPNHPSYWPKPPSLKPSIRKAPSSVPPPGESEAGHKKSG